MQKEDLKYCIRVAMGQEPADILFINAKLVSTFTEEAFESEMAIARGRIVALGHVQQAVKTIDLKGAYICPSLIDAHIHIESSMMSPEGFAEAVVPHGTGAVVSDPHEIANVFGLKGIEYMLRASAKLPVDIRYSIPSCVPATPMETSGGELKAGDIHKAHSLNPMAPSLSEMMNYPGVFLGMDEVLDKICTAQSLGLNIDGHAPMLDGKELNGYLNARIFTDHECTSVAEATEKLRRGMYVLMREGSAARNLQDLLPVLSNQTAHRIAIATDDRHPDQLAKDGHLDYIWRKLIQLGVDPIRALRLITLNPAQIYRLEDMGALGVGYRANFIIVENLEAPIVREVYYNGCKVAENGQLLAPLARKESAEVQGSIHLPSDLATKLGQYPQSGPVRVIGLLEGQLVTEKLTADASEVQDGELAFLAVVERHGQNGQVGLGFVKGLGIQSGALASTVAHDNHNLILVGKSIPDMIAAAQATAQMGGGFAVVQNQIVKAALPLPIAGLMSLKSAREVATELGKIDTTTREIGISIASPFMVLSFLALSVIPHLKLTDKGLVDVDRFELVDLRP